MGTCRKYTARLAAYGENRLPPDEAARVAAHLAACPVCREELAALRAMGTLLRVHRPLVPEPAPDLWSRIHSEIVPARPRVAWFRSGWMTPAAGLAAALALAALVRPGLNPAPRADRVAIVASEPAPPAVPEAPPSPVTPPPAAPALRDDNDPFLRLDAREPKAPAPKPVAAPPRPRAVVAQGAVRKARPAAAPAPKAASAPALPEKAPPAIVARVEGPQAEEGLPIGSEGRDAPKAGASRWAMAAREARESASLSEPAQHNALATAEPAPSLTPMRPVPATASAVEEALSSERRLDLFRYSSR